MSLLPAAGVAAKLSGLQSWVAHQEHSEKLPALFLGHGSPMNAIEENEFVQGFKNIAKTFARPRAILVVSAHWETKGTWVTAMEQPRTIHDFGGFPEALYQVQYPAPGSPQLAKEVEKILLPTPVSQDFEWGLDHGAWSVVKHLYPNADVPIIQMSIDYTKPFGYHYELAKSLSILRQKGVLIIGSGNLVHNLGRVAWDKLHTPNYAYDWAAKARTEMNELILGKQYDALVNILQRGKEFSLAIPTPEHYLPLLYVLGTAHKNDALTLFNDKAVGGSLSMTSVRVGS